MKKITLRAEEKLIKQARLLARAQHTTLSAAFRKWLLQFTIRQEGDVQEFRSLMLRLSHVNSGRHFSREEMNSR